MKIPFALRAAWEAQELIRALMKADAIYTFHILIKHTSNLIHIHTQRKISLAQQGSFLSTSDSGNIAKCFQVFFSNHNRFHSKPVSC